MRIITCVWCYACVRVNVICWVHCINMLFISWWVYVMELYFPCMMRWWVFCWQYVILMCWILGVFCLAWKLLVELNVVWGFPYLGTQWRLFRLCEAVERGPLRLCEAVVDDWFECCTLSPVWSSGEGINVSPYFGSLRV